MWLFLGVLLAAGEPSLTLDRLLEGVARNAPQVRTQAAAIDVARAATGVAGAWEDPTIAVMAEDAPFPGMRMGAVPMNPMLTYSVAQPLNLFGRRRLAKEAAQARVGIEKAALRRVEWDARAEAVIGFYELWMNAQMAEILERQIATLERMRASGLARYAAGLMMGHHEVLRAEAELAAMRAERASLDDERTAIVTMLNVLRGVPREAAIGEAILPPRLPLPEAKALLTRADSRPEVRSMQLMRSEMEARRALAGRMYLPMVMTQLFYQQRTGGSEPDSWGGELALSVPLWWFDRQKHEVEMADAMVARAQRDLEAMQAMTEAAISAAYSRARAAERTLVALEGAALPRMRETVASTLAAYVSGTSEFLLLLESSMSLRNLEMERVRALVRREIARYELARLLGEPLENT